MGNKLLVFTAHKGSCGKVMFSHVCVCSQGDWVCQVQGPFLEGGYVQRCWYVRRWICPDGVYVQGIGGLGMWEMAMSSDLARVGTHPHTDI